MRLIYHLCLPPCLFNGSFELIVFGEKKKKKNPVSFSSSTLEPAWRQVLVKVLATPKYQKHFWSFLCYVQYSSRDEPDWSRKRIKQTKRQAWRHKETQKARDLWILSDWNHRGRNLRLQNSEFVLDTVEWRSRADTGNREGSWVIIYRQTRSLLYTHEQEDWFS